MDSALAFVRTLADHGWRPEVNGFLISCEFSHLLLQPSELKVHQTTEL
jgi:hypothetical protein